MLRNLWFVGNYALCGLSPKMYDMLVITKQAGKLALFTDLFLLSTLTHNCTCLGAAFTVLLR